MSLITEGADLVRPAGADARVEPSLAGVGDYLALLKPRVMSLVVFTALAGLVVAPGHMHPVLAFFALVCIAVGAGAAGALLGRVPRPDDQRAGRWTARLHDLLLRRRLHDVAQALDAPKHRHRWG